jgi:TetR/AcrR family transcriptional regulator, acrAB operon repressor
LTAAELAMDTHLFFSGLLHMWVKDTEGTLFRDRALQLIDTHIKLRKK